MTAIAEVFMSLLRYVKTYFIQNTILEMVFF